MVDKHVLKPNPRLKNHEKDETSKSNKNVSIKEKSFQCYLCQRCFPLLRELRIHMKCHERSYKCEICRSPLTFNELNTHLCGKEESIDCDYCPNTFIATSKLVKHIETSHGKRKFYQCEKCPKFFPMITLKEWHIITHAQDLPRLFVCNICSKAYAMESVLKTHIKSHDKTISNTINTLIPHEYYFIFDLICSPSL